MKKIGWPQVIFLLIANMSFAALAATPLRQNNSPSSGIPVLMYHEIVSDGSKKPGREVITLDKFKEQMKFLKENGYQTLNLKEFFKILQGKTQAPDKALVITLDDGFKNAVQAVPILEHYGFKASFWIIPGKGINGMYMDWETIKALDRNPLFEVESHSYSHPYKPEDNMVSWIKGLTKNKGESEVRFELEESKRLLELHLGHPIRYFAWPCGWYNQRLIELASEAGYEALFTAWNGLNSSGQDLMQIHRTVVDGSNDINVFSAQLRDGLHRT